MQKNAETPVIWKDLLDELLISAGGPQALLGENGLLNQLTAGLVERALEAELTNHLGYPRHSPRGYNTGNSRNGHTPKTLKTERRELTIEVPGDRVGTFEPQLVRKGQTRFTGFDDQIISMYSRGKSARDIPAHLKEMYGMEVSAEFIARWQMR